MWNEIEEPLLSLRAGNIPLERDLWEDFYRYLRALTVAPDLERQECGRTLNQRMRHILAGELRLPRQSDCLPTLRWPD